MPRVNVEDFADESKDQNVIRVKTPKPRNPLVRDLYDGKFPPKKHKDKRRSASRFDKRNIEY
ncbi:MAG TPA: hypothetical protein VFM18_13310 [Methanosarcina sp.]|nr:hypothetical protein [Methanosarcina sp.]